MKIIIQTILISLLICGCKADQNSKDGVKVKSTKDYELHKVPNEQATLILFPGGGTTSKEIKEEFKILASAAENNISVLLMNFNRHLWINESQTNKLSKELERIFTKHELNSDKVIMGGMSIGGNVALTLSNYQIQNNISIAPKGVFMVDSPIDLYSLYESALIDLGNPKLDEKRLAEPKFIVNYFEENFGKASILAKIQVVSPFTIEVQKNNVSFLKETKLRFYTEPDSIWWKKNRQTDFKNTNAHMIKQVSENLKMKDWQKFELIETQNKGYRSNGQRHPHSWSIVDTDALISWIIN